MFFLGALLLQVGLHVLLPVLRLVSRGWRMVVTLVGEAVARGTLMPFVVPPLLGAFLSRKYIRPGESAPSEEFGPVHDRYRNGTRRWL